MKVLFPRTVIDDKARKVKIPRASKSQHLQSRQKALVRYLKLKLAEAESSLFLVEKDSGVRPDSQARAYPVVNFRQARSQYPILSYREALTVPAYIRAFFPQS